MDCYEWPSSPPITTPRGKAAKTAVTKEEDTASATRRPARASGGIDYSRFDAIGSGSDSDDNEKMALAASAAFFGLPPQDVRSGDDDVFEESDEELQEELAAMRGRMR